MIPKKIALIGNPNSGKTTLFNRLTRMNYREGNYSGVTVESCFGSWDVDHDISIEVVDLPGCYSLQPFAQDGEDMRETIDTINQGEFDCVVNVVDALNLQRHFYLTHQLRELDVPMVLLVNRIDLAKKHNIDINLDVLSEKLQCPVLGTIATDAEVVDVLYQAVSNYKHKSFNAYKLNDNWTTLQEKFLKTEPNLSHYGFLLKLEAGHPLKAHYDSAQMPLSVGVADLRYQHIEALVSESVVKRRSHTKSVHRRIDQIVLHDWLGLPIFFLVMYGLFTLTMSFAGNIQIAVDAITHALLVDGVRYAADWLSLPSWWGSFLGLGIGQGIATTLTFTPILFCMFMGLGFLEHSGYMARSALLMDRLMRKIGLPGRSLVSFIIGFGCNVPAIMAARHLDQPRERLMTILMTPFMSCGARLTIYAVMVTAFFPQGGHNIIFILYLIGIAAAILTGYLLQPSLSLEQPLPLVMEMPDYQKPKMKLLVQYARRQTIHFVKRAAKYVIPLSTILTLFMHFDVHGNYLAGNQMDQSMLATSAKALTVLFYPLGITENNWPATVGLISGLLAKEVVVGSMNALYGQVVVSAEPIWPQILHGIHDMLNGFLHFDLVPSIDVVSNQFHASAYGEMLNAFESSASVFAFLVFALLYFPCMSTIAVIRKELGRGWASISLVWSTMLAYFLAIICYQLGSISSHPVTSLIWLASMVLVLIILMIEFKKWVKRTWEKQQYDAYTT